MTAIYHPLVGCISEWTVAASRGDMMMEMALKKLLVNDDISSGGVISIRSSGGAAAVVFLATALWGAHPLARANRSR